MSISGVNNDIPHNDSVREHVENLNISGRRGC